METKLVQKPAAIVAGNFSNATNASVAAKPTPFVNNGNTVRQHWCISAIHTSKKQTDSCEAVACEESVCTRMWVQV